MARSAISIKAERIFGTLEIKRDWLIYKLNETSIGIEVLSFFHVCENRRTDETVGEAARQSGGHTAIMLALRILSFHANILQ